MKEINRRSFLKKATLIGAGTFLGDNLIGNLMKEGPQSAWDLDLALRGIEKVTKRYFSHLTLLHST